MSVMTARQDSEFLTKEMTSRPGLHFLFLVSLSTKGMKDSLNKIEKLSFYYQSFIDISCQY